MELYVKREHGDAVCTPGELLWEGDVHEAWTLELPIGDGSGHAPFCILPGRYKLEMRLSPHFKKMLPHVCSVPFREWILIHVGNSVKDTEGCLLVGQDRGHDVVLTSTTESERLNAKLTALLNTGTDVWINYVAAA